MKREDADHVTRVNRFADAAGPRPGRDGVAGADAERVSSSQAERAVDRAYAKELFRRFTVDRNPLLREELVGLHLPLVEYLARRFRNRGEPLEDLVQVGTIGLLKAIDRFDLQREVEFSTYATPTIVGELKRHFRDKGWAVRVPRRLQELNLSLNKVVAQLSQEIGRSPTIAEIAAKAGMSQEEVLEGLETLEYRAALGPLIAELPERERRILYLRFFRGMTQSQIAGRLGISQMHVSRLLARSLAQLREHADDDTAS